MVSNREYQKKSFGAEVVRTPACQGTDGAIREARRILEEDPDTYYMPYQFSHPGNPLAHYETTGPEIWEQTNGEVNVFVAGMGTTGTLMGVSRYLKEKSKDIRIVGAEPVKGHKIQGLKNMTEAIVPEIYEPDRLDQIIEVKDEPAFDTTRRLTMEEGIFVGISSGAAVAAAIEVAKEMDSGTIVTLLPDRGDRYLSTTLFRSVCADCPP